MTLSISLIYARSEDYCIGRAGRVPWHLPDEFAHFKRTTLHHPIVMGRRTYEDHQTLLPERTNIVVSRTPGYELPPGVHRVGSLEEALELASRESDEAFVVGGVRLFEESFARASRVYETVVHTRIADGDTFVPKFDFGGWHSSILEEHPIDRVHPFSYTVSLHERREGA